jgi:hypothetical protein
MMRILLTGKVFYSWCFNLLIQRSLKEYPKWVAKNYLNQTVELIEWLQHARSKQIVKQYRIQLQEMGIRSTRVLLCGSRLVVTPRGK